MLHLASSQPTDRSGSSSTQPSELHNAPVTTPSDNGSCSFPSLSPGDGSLYSPPLSVGSNSAYIMHDGTQSEALASDQSFPSLQIRTDIPNGPPISPAKESDDIVHRSLSSDSLPRRTPSFRGLLSGPNPSVGSLSPASVLSSPQLMAMGDITPLPSPIGGFSPWKLPRRNSQSLSRTPSTASRNGSALGLRLSDSSQMLGPLESRSRSKHYVWDKAGGDKVAESPSKPRADNAAKHARNRSLSEYVPPGKCVHVKPRQVAVSVTGGSQGISTCARVPSSPYNLHREQYLAVHRGIALPPVRPPTPPRSSGFEKNSTEPVITHPPMMDGPDEVYSVSSIRTQQPRQYRKLRQLGQGTFSQVCLAVRMEKREGASNTGGVPSSLEGVNAATQKLVAVKIIDHGPAGGADEERLEVSLKREVDILKSINHPSLVQLKAFGSDAKRALLVLDYCPGGDLFDVASSGPRPMAPGLIRRIFAEMVDAVRYLHSHLIVHRDIKLENVLMNLPYADVENISDWRTYDRAIVTLSDLGLSRRIPEAPESQLLHTRCGSEDYAAPEILMGQPYDGRLTDAWALGVLLYAMMENRLPFDALPGSRGDPAKLRARVPHRIARIEWSWYRYADSDGEWDPEKGAEVEGARECVEMLLKRNTKRQGLDAIAATEYVKGAIDVPAGLKRGDKEVP